MTGRIRVGVVGANADKGWGGAVHLPVLGLIEDFELVAVATTRDESARASAARFGARLHFTDPAALAAHPDVDLVVVCVKAPDHYRVTMPALAAGKHVYCEWPLAANAAQAAEMAEMAARRGVRAMTGLQARGAPALIEARRLLTSGAIGRPIAVRLNCALPGGGRRRSREGLYVIDRANGASTLAIQGGHAIDALRFVCGDFASVAAVVDTHFDEVEVIETGAIVAKDAPDEVLVSGRLLSGAVVSVCLTGGIVAGHGIALDIFGEKGSLSVGWPGAMNFQMSELTLRVARSPDRRLEDVVLPADDHIPTDFATQQPYPGVAVPRATLVNVATLYRRLAAAIRDGAEPDPDFATGLSLHHLLDTIEVASQTGTVRPAAGRRQNEEASFRAHLN